MGRGGGWRQLKGGAGREGFRLGGTWVDGVARSVCLFPEEHTRES